jgi:hypothetical protein
MIEMMDGWNERLTLNARSIPWHARSIRSARAELQEAPSPEAFDRFCALSVELAELAERSVLRSLERQRCQDMCIADLQAGIEKYCRLFDEHLRLVDFVHQQQVLALQKQAELERRRRLHAENEILKAAREIQLRRDHE